MADEQKSPSWPVGLVLADIEALVKPLRQAIDAGYKLTRKNHGQTIPYKGLDVEGLPGQSESGIRQQLSRSSLEYHAEHGRDALTVILAAAISLGFEQGRRWQIAENATTDLYSRMLVYLTGKGLSEKETQTIIRDRVLTAAISDTEEKLAKPNLSSEGEERLQQILSNLRTPNT